MIIIVSNFEKFGCYCSKLSWIVNSIINGIINNGNVSFSYVVVFGVICWFFCYIGSYCNNV